MKEKIREEIKKLIIPEKENIVLQELIAEIVIKTQGLHELLPQHRYKKILDLLIGEQKKESHHAGYKDDVYELGRAVAISRINNITIQEAITEVARQKVIRNYQIGTDKFEATYNEKVSIESQYRRLLKKSKEEDLESCYKTFSLRSVESVLIDQAVLNEVQYVESLFSDWVSYYKVNGFL